ncbi:MAG: cell division protein FtsA [Treponema sp.]|nr:cell division protein FtsA [Treponema sp.]
MNRFVVGLDLGTNFVRVVIGEVSEEGVLEIIGTAKRPSSGLRNGVIVNRENTMECIKSVIEEAEQNAGYEVVSCVTAIGGSQIESLNSTGLVAISSHGRGEREITKSDVDRVLENATAIQIPIDRKILHLIPQNYIVDGQSDYKNPVNIIGVRLEAEVHIVTASKTSVQNLMACVERSGYQLDNVMLKTLACTSAVMCDEERELGSILIDLGGSTTDVLVIINDAPVLTVSIPVGGNLVTNDIAIVKGVSPVTAENLKIECGCCWIPMIDNDDEIIIPGVGGRNPEVTSKSELCQIIQPRMEEIFSMVRDEVIQRSNLTQLSGNIILTGGGAMMEGAVELAQEIFKTSAVRIGIPSDFGGLQEEYRRADFATAIGLVLEQMKVNSKLNKKERRKDRDASKTSDKDFLTGLKKIFTKFF